MLTNTIFSPLPFRDDKNERKSNILKLLLTVALFTVSQYLERFLLKDIASYFVTNMFISTLILGIVYSDKSSRVQSKRLVTAIISYLNKWKTPFIQVGIIFITLATIETIYIPPLVSIGIKTAQLEILCAAFMPNCILEEISLFYSAQIVNSII